jgi:hypothetical protein
MSWKRFKGELLPQMNSFTFGKDSNKFAKALTRSYDFTIKSLRMIIEYHGTYWHPRDIETWKNPIDFYVALSGDQHKENLATGQGMEYNIVWSDCNKAMMYDMITYKIKRKLYDSRS